MSITEADKKALDTLQALVDDDESSIEKIHIVLGKKGPGGGTLVQALAANGGQIAAVANDRLSECAKLVEKCIEQQDEARAHKARIIIDPTN